MYRDFFATMAQVLPVLLLTLVWDAGYLEHLRTRARPLRRDDPVNGVWFWTKGRVRGYSLMITGLLIVGVGVSLLVLAGLVEDAMWLRVALVGVLIMALTTLFVRVGGAVLDATRP